MYTSLDANLTSHLLATVGNADQFRERFPNNVILSAVVSHSADLLATYGSDGKLAQTWVNAAQPETGVIVHKGQEKMQIGVEWAESLARDAQQAKLEDFVALLAAGGSEYDLVPDIQQWRWKVSHG